MLKKIQNHLAQNFPILKNKKLFIAISGGLDSMVMASVFQELNYTIALVHCNFQLRGVESFEDQKMVTEYADANGLPIFTTQFDTENFAKDYRLSIQVAARELRYNWFYELLESENYDYVLTAHHADDNLETFLINLSRGSGLEGFTGIPSHNDKIIRPFLAVTREEILDYAQEKNIQWREDSSNASDKYLRNKIRHNLVPLLKELNPNFLASFQKTQSYLQEAKVMVEDATIMIYQQVAKEIEDEIHFDLKKLKKLPNYKSYLYQWLNEFGFSAWNDIYDLVEAQSGKQVFSENFRLVKDRHLLLLSPYKSLNTEEEYTIIDGQKEINIPLKLVFTPVDNVLLTNNSTIFVDKDKLKFPLLIRKWRTGDSFYPLGMKGKSKKVSKFFKDEKFSLLEKETTWILFSDTEIVWIIGFRQDERFRIDDKTQNRLQIALL